MELVEKIKQVANIVDIASAYTTLRRRGKKYVGLCPFHAERNPSFTVDEEKQLYHCFGCGAGGDIFSLVMEKENLNFSEAVRFLAEKYHLPLPRPARLSPEVTKLEARLYEINELALGFFERQLHQSAEGLKALGYLRRRGLDEKTVAELRLGYAPDSWNALTHFLKDRGIAPAEILKAGLALPGQRNQEIYDRFRGRIIFPIFSLSGRVIAFGGRLLGEGEPKYLNSPDTPVYTKGQILYGLNLTKDSIRARDEIILVEGYMDFIALYQAGIRNCAASCGTSLTLQQVALAQRFASRIIISTDGDEAGQRAALRAVSLCLEKGMPAKVVLLPEKMDPDNFIRLKGKEEYLKLVNQAFSGFDFLVESYRDKFKNGPPEARAQAIRAVVQEIEKVPDPIIRSDYFRLLSEKFNVDESLIRNMAQEKEEKESKIGPPSQLLAAEKRLLQILDESTSLARQLLAEIKPEEAASWPGAPIFLYLIKKPDRPSQLLSELKAVLSPPLYQELAKVLLERPAGGTRTEAKDCLRTLRRYCLEKEISEVQRKIAQLERQGQREEMIPLLLTKQKLTREILSLQ